MIFRLRRRSTLLVWTTIRLAIEEIGRVWVVVVTLRRRRFRWPMRVRAPGGYVPRRLRRLLAGGFGGWSG